MANIGATTAFYKVETSLTREQRSEQEHGASGNGKANANAGDRSSYVAMADFPIGLCWDKGGD